MRVQAGWRQAVRQPVARQIQPVAPRILTDVAGDVGELHGDAEIDRMAPGGRIGHAQHVAHHQPDRAGGAVRVAEQPGLVLDPDRAEIGQHGVDQRSGGLAIDAEAAEPAAEAGRRAASGEIVADRAQGDRGGGAVRRLVGEIVDGAAGGVQRGGAREALAPEQPSGQAERAPVTRQHGEVAAIGLDARLSRRRHPSARGIGGPGEPGIGCEGHVVDLLGQIHHAASASRVPTSLADVKTPGTPAPGWVPAPTRYSPSAALQRLWKRKNADWRRIGAIEKPAPSRDR